MPYRFFVGTQNDNKTHIGDITEICRAPRIFVPNKID